MRLPGFAKAGSFSALLFAATHALGQDAYARDFEQAYFEVTPVDTASLTVTYLEQPSSFTKISGNGEAFAATSGGTTNPASGGTAYFTTGVAIADAYAGANDGLGGTGFAYFSDVENVTVTNNGTSPALLYFLAYGGSTDQAVANPNLRDVASASGKMSVYDSEGRFKVSASGHLAHDPGLSAYGTSFSYTSDSLVSASSTTGAFDPNQAYVQVQAEYEISLAAGESDTITVETIGPASVVPEPSAVGAMCGLLGLSLLKALRRLLK